MTITKVFNVLKRRATKRLPTKGSKAEDKYNGNSVPKGFKNFPS
jgi:hypothetical protein